MNLLHSVTDNNNKIKSRKMQHYDQNLQSQSQDNDLLIQSLNIDKF